MTSEQLEELANGRNPNFIQNMDWEEIVTTLARRVIDAEKLVQAGSKLASAAEYGFVTGTHIREWDKAEKAYREASK